MGCKQIDSAPGPAEHLGSLPVLEELELQRCQLRDKESMVALFMVCERVTEIRLKDCWGFDDQMFGTVGVCRYFTFFPLLPLSFSRKVGFLAF